MKLAEVLKVLVVVVVVVAMVMSTAEAIWLELPSSEVKCVYEDLRNNIVVLANYVVIHDDKEHAQANPLPTISVQVQSPLRNNLHHEENVTYGQFAFTTIEAGNYLGCFRMNSPVPGNKSVTVALQWKTGIDAKDWDSIARKEKIEGIKGVTIGIDWKIGIAEKDWDSVARKEKIEEVELVLMKLEASAQVILEKLIYLKKREEEMREVSERTNAAVEWFSIMSLSICILVAALQIWYLKRFFWKKKLIYFH